MSARVFKPIPLTEMHKVRASPSIDGNFCCYKGDVQKVRRSLFAIPDPEETKKFLKEEFAKLENCNREKWDFDFVTGKPTNITRRYEWTVVSASSNYRTRPAKQQTIEYEGPLELYPPISSSSATTIPEEEMEEEMFTDAVEIQHSPSKQQPKKQSLITDFMQARKRIEETSYKKKIDTNNLTRPKKMPRMSLADSAS